MTWDEIERLRRMVPARADWLLTNWARWSRAYRGQVGFRNRSAGFAGSGISSVEDMEDEADAWTGELADAVIDCLPVTERNAIAAVYAGGQWSLRPDLLAPTLIEATAGFWYRAQRKGLT